MNRQPKKMIGGVHMGKPHELIARGAFGKIFSYNGSHLLVKQLADETGNAGGRGLVKEYHIASFLGSRLPDFVAAPFSLMRGVNEKLSLLQQRIHGKTFDDINFGEFTKKELWSMFLQFNEFILRLGDVMSMHDVHHENVMVDVRVPGAPRVKFIDFGFWKEEDGDPSKPCKIMLQNFYFAFSTMKCLLFLMQIATTEGDKMYRPLFMDYSGTSIDELLRLPSKLALFWATNIRDSNGITDKDKAEFSVIEKLCAIRYMQSKEKKPIDVISYQDDLDHLITIMPHQAVPMMLLALHHND